MGFGALEHDFNWSLTYSLNRSNYFSGFQFIHPENVERIYICQDFFICNSTSFQTQFKIAPRTSSGTSHSESSGINTVPSRMPYVPFPIPPNFPSQMLTSLCKPILLHLVGKTTSTWPKITSSLASTEGGEKVAVGGGKHSIIQHLIGHSWVTCSCLSQSLLLKGLAIKIGPLGITCSPLRAKEQTMTYSHSI